MRIRFLLVFLLSGIFAGNSLYGQNKERLRKAVADLVNAKEDTIMVMNLDLVAWDTSYDNLSLGLRYSQQSLRLAEKLKYDNGIIHACNTQGTIYADMGDLNQALNFHLRGLSLAEKNKNPGAQGTAELNISGVYITMKEYSKALEYMHRAQKNYEQVGNHSGLAVINNTMGSCYLNYPDSTAQALASYSKAFELATEQHKTTTIAVSLAGIANCFHRLGDTIRSDEAIRRSVQLLDSIKSNYDLSIVLAVQAKILKERGHYRQAETILLRALGIYRSVGMLEQEVQVWEELSEIYEKTGQLQLALDARKKFSKLKDSVMNENVFRKQRELEAVYENEKRENQIRDLKQENKISELGLAKQKAEAQRLTVFISFGLIALLLVVGFAGYILYSLQQKKKANTALGKAYAVIEETNKNITDSINYARKIQEAVLPSEGILKNQFRDAFVFFRPRDIVSGDFWWCTEKEGEFILAAADCTGHGVPGGFMSVMGAAFLSEIVNEKGITDPAEVLSLLRLKVIAALKQTQEVQAENKPGRQVEVKDGMDIVFCSFGKNNQMQFAAANNPVWLIRNKTLHEFGADKFPVGIYHGDILPFSRKETAVETGDMIYLFSDGYADQFGGPQGKKFKYKQLKELLLSIAGLPCAEQQLRIKNSFENWKGKLEQVDDILVIGIKI